MFTVWQVLQFFFSIAASIMLITVVASDVILQMLWKSYEQSKSFQGTKLQENLESRFTQLREAGLAGAGPLPTLDEDKDSSSDSSSDS